MNWELPQQVRAENMITKPGIEHPLDINVTLKWADGRSCLFHNSFMQAHCQAVDVAGYKVRNAKRAVSSCKHSILPARSSRNASSGTISV